MRTASGRNTPEYRGRITEAARAPIPVVLRAVGGTLATSDIYKAVQRRAPEVCDDSVQCHVRGHEHSEWEHQVDWALQQLKHRGVVKNAARGLWKLV